MTDKQIISATMLVMVVAFAFVYFVRPPMALRDPAAEIANACEGYGFEQDRSQCRYMIRGLIRALPKVDQ
jgi:hypothetical protein